LSSVAAIFDITSAEDLLGTPPGEGAP